MATTQKTVDWDSLPFGGPDVTPADSARMGRQLQAVRKIMLCGDWFTLEDLRRELDRMGIVATTPGISARFRELKTPKGGSHETEKKLVAPGLYRYRIVK